MGLIKFVTIITAISSYFLVTWPGLFFFKKYPQQTRRVLNKIVSIYSNFVLWAVNAKVDPELKEKAYSHKLIVSNHLSYMDIMVMSSLVPSSFVTSVEMKNTPVLGQIVILAGCLFVERRNKSKIKNEIKDIEDALTSGLNVVVFPEATSTNGEGVLKFKRSLFQASVNTGAEVTPVTINYTHINGKPVDTSTRDLVCWYGDMDFASHLWKLCHQKEIRVSIKFADNLNPQPENDTALLRDTAYEKVSENYRPIV